MSDEAMNAVPHEEGRTITPDHPTARPSSVTAFGWLASFVGAFSLILMRAGPQIESVTVVAPDSGLCGAGSGSRSLLGSADGLILRVSRTRCR